MSNAAVVELRAVAGLEVYRRNPFRLTGLPTDVDRRTARHRQQQLTAVLQVGADLPEDVTAADPNELRGAFERVLGDPRRRLVEELFWLWGSPGAKCRCPRQIHHEHDEAVRAHSAVLEQELTDLGRTPHPSAVAKRGVLWVMASRHWDAALKSKHFWEHVRHRIDVLDDRQLDRSVIAELRKELPVALVRPLTELAAATPAPLRLATIAREWPVPKRALELRLEEIAEPLYDEIHTLASDLIRRLHDEDAQRVANDVTRLLRPKLNRLEALVPHAQHRRTASARERVGIVLNNCATQLIENGPVLDGQAAKWLDEAGELAGDTPGADTVAANKATLDEMRRTLESIRSQVNYYVGIGSTYSAKAMLRRVRAALGDGPGAYDVNKMLADLGGRRVTEKSGARYGWLWWALIGGAAVGALVRWLAGW
jgi:hypothetical protein